MATTPNSVICKACGGEVLAFARKPHMYRFIIETDNADEDPVSVINEAICTDCMTDLIKYKSEVLAHKWDDAKGSIDKHD